MPPDAAVTQSLWPWLAVAAAGALHGLNPAAGWALAAWSWRAGGKLHALRMLLPIAAGHVASVLIVAAAVPLALQLGVEFDPLLPQWLAAGLLLALVVQRVRGRAHCLARVPTGQAGIALWSFIVGTAHGAGWMLVPALVPLCANGMPGGQITASGSAWLALAAVGVHLAAMLATTAAMAAGAQRGLHAVSDWLEARGGERAHASEHS